VTGQPRESRDTKATQAPKGIACRACGCRHLEVVYTRQTRTGVMRRRECRHCGKRLTTYEREG
jgi:hypothetical protein